MSLSHIIVIVFMLITAGFIVWLEVHSRKNTRPKEEVPKDGDRQTGS